MTCSADSAAGVFISFEGGDGAGKSTHMAYLCQAISSLGREVVRLREPGGTPIGEQLRQIVLDPANQELSERAELFITFRRVASRGSDASPMADLISSVMYFT